MMTKTFMKGIRVILYLYTCTNKRPPLQLQHLISNIEVIFLFVILQNLELIENQDIVISNV